MKPRSLGTGVASVLALLLLLWLCDASLYSTSSSSSPPSSSRRRARPSSASALQRHAAAVCVPEPCSDRSFASVFSAAQHASCYHALRAPEAQRACAAALDEAGAAAPLSVHVFWAGAPLQPQHLLVFETFLLTQPSNATLTLWLLHEPLTRRATWHADAVRLLLLERFPRLRVRRFDPEVELRAQEPEDELWMRPIQQLVVALVERVGKKQALAHEELALLSDAVRLVVLYRHGGVYVDLDVVLLRDLTPLLALRPFAHGWSWHTYRWNTAVMGAEAGDSDIEYVLRDASAFITQHSSSNTSVQLSAFHPLRTGHRLAGKPGGFAMTLLSVYLFDPVWLVAESKEPLTAVSRGPYEGRAWTDVSLLEVADALAADRSFSFLNLAPGAFAFHHHDSFGPAPVTPTRTYKDLIHNAFLQRFN